MNKEQRRLEERAKDYAFSQFAACTDTKMGLQAALGVTMFKGYDIAAGYKDGYEQAMHDIEKQIDFAAINSYKFPILHLRDFIDKTLGRK